MAVADRMEYVDPFTPTMMVLGIVCIVTLLEAIRRAVEPGLAWMVAGSLAYMEWGYMLPGVLNARPFSPPRSSRRPGWCRPRAASTAR